MPERWTGMLKLLLQEGKYANFGGRIWKSSMSNDESNRSHKIPETKSKKLEGTRSLRVDLRVRVS